MEKTRVILKARLHHGSPVFGYVLAVALVAVAGVASLALMTAATKTPFMMFYPAICLVSFLAGLGPGLLAVLGGAVFASFLFPSFPQPMNWIALSVLGPLLVSGFAHLREVRERNHATALERARFRFISDHAVDWLLLIGERGEIEYVNQAAAGQLGFDPAGMWGRRLQDFAPEWQETGLTEMLTRCRNGGPVTAEATFQRRDGSLLVVEAGCTAVETGGETVMHVAARDITERREMEAKLREAQKWESLGAMAGGLAHDFNNLLTSILGNASLAREFLAEEHPVIPRLEAIEHAGERSAELVRLMLATAGHRSRHAERVPMGRILEQTLATRRIPAHIQVRTEVEAPEVHGDKRSMGTLLESLISNAAEAYGPASGEVRVRICASDLPALGPASFEEGSAEAGTCLGIIVEDRGCGMTKEVLARAFDPFFSTKFTGRGLGLPAVRGLVRAHAGKLWLKTEPGGGTRVEIWLPESPGQDG